MSVPQLKRNQSSLCEYIYSYPLEMNTPQEEKNTTEPTWLEGAQQLKSGSSSLAMRMQELSTSLSQKIPPPWPSLKITSAVFQTSASSLWGEEFGELVVVLTITSRNAEGGRFHWWGRQLDEDPGEPVGFPAVTPLHAYFSYVCGPGAVATRRGSPAPAMAASS